MSDQRSTAAAAPSPIGSRAWAPGPLAPLLLALAALAAAGCGTDSPTPAPEVPVRIVSVSIPATKIILGAQGSQTITVAATGGGGLPLTAVGLFDPALAGGPNPALQWTVGDPTIVSIAGQQRLSITVYALRPGLTTLTATDPLSGAQTSAQVQVSSGNVVITPPAQAVRVGSRTTFTVGLATGGVPSGATATWTLTGEGSLGGVKTLTTSTLSIGYDARAAPGSDALAVELKDAGGVSLGVSATAIQVTFESAITPDTPTVPQTQTQVFTVDTTNATPLPTGSTYGWLLTGSGTLVGGGKAATTTAPWVTYTAPSTQGQDSLTVVVVAADGTVGSMATTLVNIAGVLVLTPPSAFVTYLARQSFSASIQPGTQVAGTPTYSWSLSGKGALATSTSLATFAEVAAPQEDGTAIVSVTARDGNGALIGTAVAPLYVANLFYSFAVSGTPADGRFKLPFLFTQIGNFGSSTPPYTTVTARFGGRTSPIFAVASGTELTTGQTFTPITLASQTLAPGKVNMLPAQSGSCTITGVANHPYGWHVVSFEQEGADGSGFTTEGYGSFAIQY